MTQRRIPVPGVSLKILILLLTNGVNDSILFLSLDQIYDQLIKNG